MKNDILGERKVERMIRGYYKNPSKQKLDKIISEIYNFYLKMEQTMYTRLNYIFQYTHSKEDIFHEAVIDSLKNVISSLEKGKLNLNRKSKIFSYLVKILENNIKLIWNKERHSTPIMYIGDNGNGDNEEGDYSLMDSLSIHYGLHTDLEIFEDEDEKDFDFIDYTTIITTFETLNVVIKTQTGLSRLSQRNMLRMNIELRDLFLKIRKGEKSLKEILNYNTDWRGKNPERITLKSMIKRISRNNSLLKNKLGEKNLEIYTSLFDEYFNKQISNSLV